MLNLHNDVKYYKIVLSRLLILSLMKTKKSAITVYDYLPRSKLRRIFKDIPHALCPWVFIFSL